MSTSTETNTFTAGDYTCDNCGWHSSDTSRPLGRGVSVGCPICQYQARFVGSHECPDDCHFGDYDETATEVGPLPPITRQQHIADMQLLADRLESQASTLARVAGERDDARKQVALLQGYAKTKLTWHRDGVGPDVPVLQERYDRLIGERDRLREALEEIRNYRQTCMICIDGPKDTELDAEYRNGARAVLDNVAAMAHRALNPATTTTAGQEHQG